MNPQPVPLAIDAQLRVPVGPFLFPLRAVGVLVAVSPVILLVLAVSALPVSYRLGLAVSVLVLAFSIATPNREGVWLVTWWVYRRCRRWVPNAVLEGRPMRAHVERVGEALRITRVRAPGLAGRSAASRLLTVPTASTPEPGVLRLVPGGSRAVLVLDGPVASIAADSYARWCGRVTRWLLALECPVQLVTVVDHSDPQRAQEAFDQRVDGWPRTPLLHMERALAARIAEQSVRFRHYVVLCPGIAGLDGLPARSPIPSLSRGREAADDDASRALQTAVRMAPGMDVRVAVPDRDDLAQLLAGSLTGAISAVAAPDGTLQLGDEAASVVTVVALPATVFPGVVVDALLRVRISGVVSLHVLPVAARVASKLLDRRAAMQRYALREGNDAVDNQVALAATASALASIAQRELQPCRIALTLLVKHAERAQLEGATERLEGLLSSRGFTAARITAPGFLGPLAATPGGLPLRRSLQLTSDGVAACMLPVLGTPYADDREGLVGLNLATGAPVYLSVWSRPNHNALVLGSSGAGKSVAAKTLLVRHVMSGASAVVIDPDSEYRRVMNALRGRYFELGDDSLNPLAAAFDESPDIGAGLVLPVLSVMTGDEKGFREGRPVRRLADEDQGWMHGEVAAFLRAWRERGLAGAPLISDLVVHLEQDARARALTRRELERCRVLTARLRRFTQGHRGQVFDRPSTFALDDRPTAIGLRAFAMTYAADLTAALAVILTAILAMLNRGVGKTIIVVDEAHRVTADPDAGDVLGQLVRQARKRAAGVWMCSQRIDDFIATDLGRTLSATASTKLLLGAEEGVAGEVADAFALEPEERAAISPLQQGRGVLLSSGERAVVSVLPGLGILALADTTPSTVRRSSSVAPTG